MLERLYTTKMSANKKQIQNRFTKIRSANSKISKMMSLVMAIFVAVTMLCATVVLASVVNEAPEQFKIEVKHGDKILQLDNKPFVYEGTVYLPLRELFEKIGFMENENSFIQWDNGKIYMCLTENVEKPDYVEYGSDIKYLSYYYGIEIGKAEYKLNPPEIVQKKYDFDSSKKTNHAPILKDGVTYIPFEFVEYLVNRTMQTSDVTCSAWDLAYNDNTERKADYINDSIGIDYANYYGEFQYEVKGFNLVTSSELNNKDATSVLHTFLKALHKADYNAMTTLCTDTCINKHYKFLDTPEVASVYGIHKASTKSIGYGYTNKENDYSKDPIIVTLNCELPAYSSAIGGEQEIKVYFEKQPDGTFLISDFTN